MIKVIEEKKINTPIDTFFYEITTIIDELIEKNYKRNIVNNILEIGIPKEKQTVEINTEETRLVVVKNRGLMTLDVPKIAKKTFWITIKSVVAAVALTIAHIFI